jgi:ketosteroid isomerase-like protein
MDAIERFVQAKSDEDVEAAAACFDEDAVVVDDGRRHEGLAAVRAWLEEVSTTFELAYELLGVERDGPVAVARVHVAGDFPGSPITFRYDAEVAGDRITRLSIAPA